MLNIRDLRIDPACLGDKMLLVEVVPAYEYKDNKRQWKFFLFFTYFFTCFYKFFIS